MKALIYGAGKIARGFVAQLLSNSCWDIVFVDINKELVHQLNTQGSYIVHVLGDPSLDTKVARFQAIALDDLAAIAQEMEDIDLVFTSVGGKNLNSLGGVIAAVWQATTRKREPVNFITCENWKHAGKTLKQAILQGLPTQEQPVFEAQAAVSEGVIMRISTQPSKKLLEAELLGEWVQNFWELPINAATFRGSLPAVQGLTLIDHFDHFLEQKLYTNNTSNALIAYYGHLLGYHVVAEAANAPVMQPLLDELYQEINQTLLAEYQVDEASQLKLAAMARKKYADWAIVDDVARHAKDPIRKLGPEDRLIAPARMALRHNIMPKVMILAIVSALYYENAEDEAAVELQRQRVTYGIPYVLETICQLDPQEPLTALILDQVKKWEQEGVLHA